MLPSSPFVFNLSQHQDLSNESALRIRWPKYWRFSFSISTSMNIQGWFPLGLTGLIFLQSRGLSRVFSSTTIWKHQFFSVQPSLWSNSHMTTGKTTALTIWTFDLKGRSLLFNTLSRYVTFPSKKQASFKFHGYSHHLQWFWSPRK